MKNMMNRLFCHISSDKNMLDQQDNEQSTHQQPNKGEDSNIQLNMRQPYTQHVKETSKLPEFDTAQKEMQTKQGFP